MIPDVKLNFLTKGKLFVFILKLNFKESWNSRLGKIKWDLSSVVPLSSLFASSKIENQYSHLPVCPAGQPASASAWSSAAEEWPICSVWKKLLHTLMITFLIFSASDFILFDSANKSRNTSYSKSFWVWNKVLKYQLIQFSGVILYPEVVLHNQPSTFTITEIFLRISNLQHVSAKL